MTTEYTIATIYGLVRTSTNWFKIIETIDNKILHIKYNNIDDDNTYKVYHHRTYIGDKIEFQIDNNKIRITDTAKLVN